MVGGTSRRVGAADRGRAVTGQRVRPFHGHGDVDRLRRGTLVDRSSLRIVLLVGHLYDGHRRGRRGRWNRVLPVLRLPLLLLLRLLRLLSYRGQLLVRLVLGLRGRLPLLLRLVLGVLWLTRLANAASLPDIYVSRLWGKRGTKRVRWRWRIDFERFSNIVFHLLNGKQSRLSLTRR